jgi:2-isopropylmalate synthase
VLKNPLTYEIMTPKSVGVPDSKLVLGKHSGRHALSIRCEQLGYSFDRRALDDVYRRFVRLADKIKHVEDHHLLELIRDTHKPTMTATPLIEPIIDATNAAVVSAPAMDLTDAMTSETNPFGVPLPVQSDSNHEQTQQEDYLWGV